MAELNHPAVNPYLTVNGAAEAIAFYGKVFGATETQRMPFEDGKRIMHAEIAINGSPVMLSDEFPDLCANDDVRAPTADRPAGVAIVLHFTDPAQVDDTYNRAIDAGCTSVQTPENMFWGARFAALRCPFGHRWMLNAALPQQG